MSTWLGKRRINESWVKTNDDMFRIEYGYVADIFAAFEAPAFWVRQLNQNWIVWNPNFFGEGSLTGELTFVTPMVDITLRLHLIGFKLSPVNFALTWSLDKKSTRCTSVNLFREWLDLQLELEFNVRECSVGLAGFFLQDSFEDVDWYECENRRYNPYLPVKQFTFLDNFDNVLNYLPWQCNDYTELETFDEEQTQTRQ